MFAAVVDACSSWEHQPDVTSFGIDRFQACQPLLKRLRGGRVGVLGHAASVDARLTHLLDVLTANDVHPVVLFAPEHGFGGAAQDMAVVGDEVDAAGRRVVSLYGDSLEALVPQADDLSDLDVLLVDLVDVGARYYTFVWTTLLAARAAATTNTHVVILDRPNPINGVHFEGRSQQLGFKSFVGWEQVPVRHGLTYAEMVALFMGSDGATLGPEGAVSFVGVDGWARADMADAWGRDFVLPSPNMPTLDTAIVYPGGCLIEGTNLSEGRGHTRPFELVGAPFIDGGRLARELGALDLRGFVARPVTFIPTFHKHGKQTCGGVQIHVTDREAFKPVAVYTALVALCHHQAPDEFKFRTERYEFVDDIPAFDLLTGSAEARERILAGDDAQAVAEHVSQPDPGWPDRMQQAIAAVQRGSWS